MQGFWMNKKYFYVWLMLAIVGFTGIFADSYWGGPEAVAEFEGKSDNEQRKIIDWLNKHGLLAQASMQGTIMALEHANIDPLIRNATRVLVSEMDRKDFPEKLGEMTSMPFFPD